MTWTSPKGFCSNCKHLDHVPYLGNGSVDPRAAVLCRDVALLQQFGAGSKSAALIFVIAGFVQLTYCRLKLSVITIADPNGLVSTQGSVACRLQTFLKCSIIAEC